MGLVRGVLLICIAALLPVTASGAAAHEEHRDRAVSASSGSAAAAAAPTVLSDSVVVPGLAYPTAFAWTPDGRLIVTEDAGTVRVVRGGTLRARPALDLRSRVCESAERGLVGVAVDPQFTTNHFIYLYWTHDVHGFCGQGGADAPENRVTRHVLGNDDLVVPGSERVLIDHLPSLRWYHQAGDLHFGADSLLYVSVGDNMCSVSDPSKCAGLNTNARRLDLPLGKILRITRDGQVPSSNPYVGAARARRCTAPSGPQPGTGPCTEIFASGLRNPFRFAQRPGTNRFFVNDVGQDTWEEVDDLVAGADYGWNVREGRCATGSTTNCGPTPYRNPVHVYPHSSGCSAVTGGVFVPSGAWPAPYSGSYLYSDYTCRAIFRLVPDGAESFTRVRVMPTVGAPVGLSFGPWAGGKTLYYVDYLNGAVHRVVLGDHNTRPVASFAHRPDGLTVRFDAAASYEPDVGDRITSYRWRFGDGTGATTTTPTVTHTYASKRAYDATLTVTDTHGAVSAPAALQALAGQHPPALAITSPAATARFAVGDAVRIAGAASDAEDGALPGTRIRWTVMLRHADHVHPFLGPVAGPSVNLTYPSPENLLAAQNSSLRVTAEVTDGSGLTTRVTRDLLPRTVTLSFTTSPVGGSLVIGGRTHRTPVSVVAWVGQVVPIAAPDQTISSAAYVFASWSDGGAQAHTVTAPGAARSWTARFVRR